MKNISIAGRLGRDAVLRDASGTPVLSFTLAVADYKKDAPPFWFDCSLFGTRAEKLAQYLTKGTQVALSGELGRREHDGKTYLTVRVDDLTLMGGGEKSPERDSKPAEHREFAQDLDDEIPF
jgi:single-strand DNA-binding protein